MTISEKGDNSMDHSVNDGDVVQTRDPFQLELLDAVRKRRSRVTGFEEEEAKSLPKFDAAKNSKLSKFMAKGSLNSEENSQEKYAQNLRPTSLIVNNDKWTPSINLDDSDDEDFLDDDYDSDEDEYIDDRTSCNNYTEKKRSSDTTNSNLKRAAPDIDNRVNSKNSHLSQYSRGSTVKDIGKENFPIESRHTNIPSKMLSPRDGFPRSSSFGATDFDSKSKKSKLEETPRDKGTLQGSLSSSSKNLQKQYSESKERSNSRLDNAELRTKSKTENLFHTEGGKKGKDMKRSPSVEEKDFLDSSFSKTLKRPIPTPRRKTGDIYSPRDLEQFESKGNKKEWDKSELPSRKSSIKSTKSIDLAERKSVVDFSMESDSDDSDKNIKLPGKKDVFSRDKDYDVKGLEPKEKFTRDGPSKISESRFGAKEHKSLGNKSVKSKERSPRGPEEVKDKKYISDKSSRPRTESKERLQDSRSKQVSPRVSPDRETSQVTSRESSKPFGRVEQDESDDENYSQQDRYSSSFRGASRSTHGKNRDDLQTLDDIFSAENRVDRKSKKDKVLSHDHDRLQSMEVDKKELVNRSKDKNSKKLVDDGDTSRSPRSKLNRNDSKLVSRQSLLPSKQQVLGDNESPSALRPKSGRRVSEMNLDSKGKKGPVKALRPEGSTGLNGFNNSLSTTSASRKLSIPTSGRSTKVKSPLLTTTGQQSVTPSPRKLSQTRDGHHQRSNSFNNISNIRPSLTKKKAEVGDNFDSSKSIRDQIYQEWLTSKTNVTKHKLKTETKLSEQQEEEKLQSEKMRKIEAQKAFEAWESTKTERLRNKHRQTKDEKKKEKEKQEEEIQKKLDAKKTFDKWKSSKDEVLVDRHRRTRSEERSLARQTSREKAQKLEDAKKTFENWKSKKDESLKEKRAKELQKSKEEKRKEKSQMEKKMKAKEEFEKWRETKPVKSRPASGSLVQRPWCPSSRSTGNAIPERVQPVIQAGTPNRARSASLTRQISVTRRMSTS